MRGSRKSWLATVLLVTVCMLAMTASVGVVSASAKTVKIYVSKGVHKARLGMTDTKTKSRVGLKFVKSRKDNNYEGQTVYRSCFGKKRSGGYDVETYSNKKHVVWMLAIFGSGPHTARGIHVSSTEAKLEKAYGSSLKKRSGDVYTIYTLGKTRGKGTDFYVKNSTHKITEINVRNW